MKGGGGAFRKGYDPRRHLLGRPLKNETPSDIFRKIGAEPLPEDVRAELLRRFPGMQPRERFMDALCRVIFAAALRGEAWAVQVVFDRAYGKVKEHLEISAAEPMVVFPKDLVEARNAVGADAQAGRCLVADIGLSDDAAGAV